MREMRDIAINRIMTTDPLIVSPGDSAATAKNTLDSNGIHHLPVVEDGVLVGILSTSDFLKLHILRDKAPALAAITVSQIMEPDPDTLDIFADLVDVARKLSESGFHALPVVEADNVLVGIVTSTDLINHLLRQVPRSDGSLREGMAPETGARETDAAAMTSMMRAAKEAVQSGKDDPMAMALLQLVEQNRLLKEVSKAAELYMRSGHGEHEHSVLIKALAVLQRYGSD
jgi:CBS domain-containing protein